MKIAPNLWYNNLITTIIIQRRGADLMIYLPDSGQKESSCRKQIDVLLDFVNEKEFIVMKTTAEELKKARETGVQK